MFLIGREKKSMYYLSPSVCVCVWHWLCVCAGEYAMLLEGSCSTFCTTCSISPHRAWAWVDSFDRVVNSCTAQLKFVEEALTWPFKSIVFKYICVAALKCLRLLHATCKFSAHVHMTVCHVQDPDLDMWMYPVLRHECPAFKGNESCSSFQGCGVGMMRFLPCVFRRRHKCLLLCVCVCLTPPVFMSVDLSILGFDTFLTVWLAHAC